MEVQRAQIIEVTKKNNTGLVTVSDLSYPTVTKEDSVVLTQKQTHGSME